MLAVALAALGLIFAVMVPALVPLFQDQPENMPAILLIATASADVLERHGTALVAMAALLLLGVASVSRTKALRDRRDRLRLTVPVVGVLVTMSATARFARMLSTLLRSGAPVPKALAVTAAATPNGHFRAALNEAVDRLKAGERLSDILLAMDCLPESSRTLIVTGESTNRLAEMLSRVAEINEKEFVRRTDRLMTLLTPILTIAVGLLVGGIVVSVMTAILSANDLAF